MQERLAAGQADWLAELRPVTVAFLSLPLDPDDPALPDRVLRTCQQVVARYEGTIDKIHYSDGRLADFVLRESELSEVLPLPYDKVKFLEQAPYHYRLKANGDTTLVDWNWNGVFGEKKIKADINYAYSTNAGRRDEIDKLHTAPWLFSHNASC